MDTKSRAQTHDALRGAFECGCIVALVTYKHMSSSFLHKSSNFKESIMRKGEFIDLDG